MNSNDPERRSTTAPRRRQFLLAGAAVGTAAIAGCTGDSTDDSTTDSSDDGTDDQSDDQPTDDDPNFRLLVSDLPADIGDFDSLDVTFDSARIFEGEDGDADEEEDSQESDADDNGAGDDADERGRGHSVLDLDGATVDLTQVIGDRAMPVFEGMLSPGTYRKVELHVATIEGIVDGEAAEVKVPSEKLQITKPFEVRADDTVDFVFDINVVRRGQGNRYNLTPVVSGSGVNGEDVDVEEVDGDEATDDGEDAGAGEEGDESADGDSADDGEPGESANADGAGE